MSRKKSRHRNINRREILKRKEKRLTTRRIAARHTQTFLLTCDIMSARIEPGRSKRLAGHWPASIAFGFPVLVLCVLRFILLFFVKLYRRLV